mmetsp:Transcript_40395/g.29760  ORF Transcript_40395/g.29760 Transcript_40395/m.29760 type:complete len:120 (-) Transcript_40395:165-524(-)
MKKKDESGVESTYLIKEVLWLLSVLLASASEECCEVVAVNKFLMDQLALLATNGDYQIKKEALVVIYNLCENHDHKFLPRVLNHDVVPAFSSVLNNYSMQFTDAYTLQVAISFFGLLCE